MHLTGFSIKTGMRIEGVALYRSVTGSVQLKDGHRERLARVLFVKIGEAPSNLNVKYSCPVLGLV